MKTKHALLRKSRRKLQTLHIEAFQNGLSSMQLSYSLIMNLSENHSDIKFSRRKQILASFFIIFIAFLGSYSFVNSFLSARCLVPSNYLVWEGTRPLANCSYCQNISRPIILKNITRREFSHYFFRALKFNNIKVMIMKRHHTSEKYAYLPGPIIVKNAISHWRATEEFTFNFFRDLYGDIAGSYESFDNGCQFLNFKTDLFSLKDVFNMPEERARGAGEPWYVGWGNCHPEMLAKVRQYYEVPKFLPKDAEFPETENIFMGYEIGAVMHLDYIGRLMWQGQVRGDKTWRAAPAPECDHVCSPFEFYVEQGDVVILDTRIWYHATKIPKGQFSVTVQSEYG